MDDFQMDLRYGTSTWVYRHGKQEILREQKEHTSWGKARGKVNGYNTEKEEEQEEEEEEEEGEEEEREQKK